MAAFLPVKRSSRLDITGWCRASFSSVSVLSSVLDFVSVGNGTTSSFVQALSRTYQSQGDPFIQMRGSAILVYKLAAMDILAGMKPRNITTTSMFGL